MTAKELLKLLDRAGKLLDKSLDNQRKQLEELRLKEYEILKEEVRNRGLVG